MHRIMYLTCKPNHNKPLLKQISGSSLSRQKLIFSSWEKAMAPYSSTLAWKIPWMEEHGRLQSMGLLRVGHDWETSFSLFTFMHWRRKWQPTPVGLLSMRSHRVGHDWSDLAAAAAVSSGPHSVRPLPHDPPVLGGPTGHGLVSLS